MISHYILNRSAVGMSLRIDVLILINNIMPSAIGRWTAATKTPGDSLFKPDNVGFLLFTQHFYKLCSQFYCTFIKYELRINDFKISLKNKNYEKIIQLEGLFRKRTNGSRTW